MDKNLHIARFYQEKGFTVIPNDIFTDKRISNAARGLLCTIASLHAEEWEFSKAGMAAICKDGKYGIDTQLKELEEAGYYRTEERRGERGRFGTTYHFFTLIPEHFPEDEEPQASPETVSPHTVGPHTVGPHTVGPATVKPAQVNTNISKYSIEDIYGTATGKAQPAESEEPMSWEEFVDALSYGDDAMEANCTETADATASPDTDSLPVKKTAKAKPKRTQFTPPTLQEVQAYISAKGYAGKVDPRHFFEYYTATDWHDAKGRKMKSWRGHIVTWAHNNYRNYGNYGTGGSASAAGGQPEATAEAQALLMEALADSTYGAREAYEGLPAGLKEALGGDLDGPTRLRELAGMWEGDKKKAISEVLARASA